ncbi:MAG TPA: alpha/beta hydrolase [Polyangiaceae bacterium]|nr:alpha/beta hydrolase [Polyangiaceae bacterium]
MNETTIPDADDPSWDHRFVHVNGVRLHYVHAGTGPLVVLLHGFPEFWYAWRRQIRRLAAAGYCVIAPDLRGYNLSTKPTAVGAYRLRVVADDIRDLIASTGAKHASIVGHDWGAAVAWATAMRHPECVERLAILNGPHPVRMLLGLSNPEQLRRSAYILFFQLPWLPEYMTRRHGWKALLSVFERSGALARWAPSEVAAYRQAYQKEGAITAMINYYRALLRPTLASWPRRVDAPVLVLWGQRDPYLASWLARPPRAWAPRARVEFLPEQGHFIQHEAPGWVAERLIAFLQDNEWANASRRERAREPAVV